MTPLNATDDPLVTVTRRVAQVAISGTTAQDGTKPQGASTAGSVQDGGAPQEAPSTSATPVGHGKSFKAKARKPKMPGSAKRRLAKLLAKGVPHKEALTMCRKPFERRPVLRGQREETTSQAASAPSTSGPTSSSSSQTRAPKRVRSEETTPPDHTRKAARAEGGRTLAFNQVASSIRVGVRDRLCNLNAEQMLAV